MIGRRVAARIGLALAVVACVVAVSSARTAHAAPPARPLDAPRVEAGARVPAPPPEYLVEDGGWVRFSYHPAARERVRSLAARADALREELVAALGAGVLELSAPVEVRVAALPTEMTRLLPPDVRGPVDAIALWDRRLVVLSLASTLGGDAPDLEAALRHALAHLALDDAFAGKPVPRWLAEGHAVRFAGDGAFARARALAGAAVRGRLVPLASLESALPADPGLAAGSVEEAEAAEAVRFVSAPRLRGVAARVRAGEPFDRALEAAFGADLVQVGRAFREDLVRRFALVPGMIAAGLVFGLAAALLAARRRRLARGGVGSRQGATLRGEVVEVRLRTPRARRVGDEDDDDDRFQGPLPPDPGVPKVEHEGQWHTLH